jgi:hypothetical protein
MAADNQQFRVIDLGAAGKLLDEHRFSPPGPANDKERLACAPVGCIQGRFQVSKFLLAGHKEGRVFFLIGGIGQKLG